MASDSNQFWFCSICSIDRVFPWAAGELETRFPRHVQTDVRHHLRAEQRSLHRSLPGPRGLLLQRQTRLGRGHESLLYDALPAHVHRHERAVSLRWQVNHPSSIIRHETALKLTKNGPFQLFFKNSQSWLNLLNFSV